MDTELLKKLSTRLAEVTAHLGKNYLISIVTEGFVPLLKEGIMECLDETKKEVGMEVPPKPKGPLDVDMKAQPLPDLFTLALDSADQVNTVFSYSFTAYTIVCIRIGTTPKGDFFALGKRYKVKYNTIAGLYRHLKKDEKDVPPLPPDCLFGTYCFCLEHKSNLAETREHMKAYFENLVLKYPQSKTVPNYFYLGDKYEDQQRSWKIFHAAYLRTKTEIIKGGGWAVDIEPFNEGDAVANLLRNVVRNEFLDELHSKVPEGAARNTLIRAVDGAAMTAVDTAISGGWPAVEAGVMKARDEVNDIVTNKSKEFVEKLKPVLKKILEKVQEKMKKKEEKKEVKQEEKKTQIGDFAERWDFKNTEVGMKFWQDLGNHDAREAVIKLDQNVTSTFEAAIQEKLSSGVRVLFGDAAADYDFVQDLLEEIANRVVAVIKKYTSIGPLARATPLFFEKRGELEKLVMEARTKGTDAINAAVNDGSMKMWSSMASIGLFLFNEMEKLKIDITAEMAGWEDSAIEQLLDVANHLFQYQMKALNSLRASFVDQLKQKLQGEVLQSEESCKAVLRDTFRDLTFHVIHVLIPDGWKSVSNAIIQASIIQSIHKFNQTVWPHLVEPLKELESMLPEAITKLGLSLVDIAQKVAAFIVTKAVHAILTFFILKLETQLFLQAKTV